MRAKSLYANDHTYTELTQGKEPGRWVGKPVTFLYLRIYEGLDNVKGYCIPQGSQSVLNAIPQGILIQM